MIPKVLHLYWGGGALSYVQHLTVVSFKRYNPEWKVKLYVPKSTDLITPTWNTGEQSDYTGKDYLPQTKKLCEVVIIDFSEFDIPKDIHEVHKSDLIRWKILYEQGGVWSDFDILYVKSIDDLLQQDFDSTICYDNTHHLIGFYVTKPNQKIYDDIYKEALERLNTHASRKYQFIGSTMLKSMFIGILKIDNYPNVYNLPMDIVYSYPPDAKVIEEMWLGTEDRTTDNTIGIHWYNGSDMSKNCLNTENYKDNQSKMAKLIREYS